MLMYIAAFIITVHFVHSFFFSSNCLQSGRYKSYNQCQSFFLTLIFLLLLSSLEYFSLLHGLEAAVRSWEIKVHVGYLGEIIDTVFINLVIYKLQEHRVKITLDAFVQN